MLTAKLRQAFLDYFHQHDHTVVASSPLVPKDDPTLLFTNAGMVQFKDVFLGKDSRDYVRAASSQRCVRAGGKHNDLENVGFTARHHTFFEMLGNFSFGDYFKREAIYFAWEFITKVLGLPPERLWVTVYEQDDEAADLWLKDVGINKTRFSRCGEKDNFWAMGDTGPCGPCSEIFYDHGPAIAGGPPGSPGADGDRYIEIWNLVFMQFNRDQQGKLTSLPKPSVDTGMGLERIAAVMQGVHNNYAIDIFKNIIHATANLLSVQDIEDKSLKVIADHLRACSFLVADGVLPSNEGRGYVLRRIMRRAIRHGYKLGATDPFFHKLVPSLVTEMGAVYPEIKTATSHIMHIIQQEEMQFAETLDNGLKVFNRIVDTASNKIIPGVDVFKLYDTYGFPVDLTADIAREKNMTLDMAGFEQSMQEQRARARCASQFAVNLASINTDQQTTFQGYEQTTTAGKIVALYKDNQQVELLQAGECGIAILNDTAFYSEAGGQIGDAGVLAANSGSFTVADTKKINKAVGHYGVVQSGVLRVNDTVDAQVDLPRRRNICSNHSATHLLHAALRQVLGNHVTQKGSVVDSERLRFDFSHPVALTAEQISAIEIIVNSKIQDNSVVSTKIMPIKEAIAAGAMALFGEKYATNVRVVTMGEVFSTELCGGTHVQRTGDIGMFKIIAEEGIAAGVRRIEAVTRLAALAWLHNIESLVQELTDTFRTDKASLVKRAKQLLQQNKSAEKDLAVLKEQLCAMANQDLASCAEDINGIKVVASLVASGDAKSLRELVDKLKHKLQSAVIVLAVVNGQKVELSVGVTQDCVGRIKAGDLIKHVASQVGGTGGGRADFAQAGGNQPEHVTAALASAVAWIKDQTK